MCECICEYIHVNCIYGCRRMPCNVESPNASWTEQGVSDLKMYTMSTRLEMYVSKAVWEELSRQAYSLLPCTVCNLPARNGSPQDVAYSVLLLVLHVMQFECKKHVCWLMTSPHRSRYCCSKQAPRGPVHCVHTPCKKSSRLTDAYTVLPKCIC